MRIGELAKLADCKAVTIRFYEKEGLLPRTDRNDSNYRIYTREDADRLLFIRHCRQHGISLSEIRDLLAFKDNPTINCDWINQLLDKHIAEVTQQIKDLEHLREHLENLQRKCSGGKRGECGILENLSHCEECAYCRNKTAK